MYFAIWSPVERRSEFALFVDQSLSRERDWNLCFYRQPDSLTFAPIMPLTEHLVAQFCLNPSSGQYWQEVQDEQSRLRLCQTLQKRFDTWVFDLSPTCTVDGIDQLAYHLDGLGCFSGLLRTASGQKSPDTAV